MNIEETWVTSDTHFNHESIIEYSERPFRDLDHMTEEMISRWNARVKRSDVVIHVGDFALSWGKKHAEVIDRILSRLNGQKFLVRGNHDRDEVTKNKRWASVDWYKELHFDVGEVHRQRFVFTHFNQRVWNQMHRGSIQCYGHSHGNLPDPGGKCLDVGVDCWDYAPVNLSKIYEWSKTRGIVAHDHHVAEGRDNSRNL